MDPLTDLDPEDQAWANAWLRYRSGEWGESKAGLPFKPGNLSQRLFRVRQYRPGAFRWLVDNDTQARYLAARTPETTKQPSNSYLEQLLKLLRSGQLKSEIPKQTNPLRDPITQLPATPRHLPDAVLDQINPLPNSRKRNARESP